LPKLEPPRRREVVTGADRRWQWTSEQKALLSRERRSIVLNPCPRQEFVETGGGPEVHEFGEDVGQIGLGIDSLKFCGLDQRRKASPIGCSFIVTGEETIFSIQRNLAVILPISGRKSSSTIVGIRFTDGARGSS
jgi:hypothetical protein